MAVTVIRCSGCGASGLTRSGSHLQCVYCGAQVTLAQSGGSSPSACTICDSTVALAVCAFCRRLTCEDHSRYWSDFHVHACRTCQRTGPGKELGELLALESDLATRAVSLQKEIAHLESVDGAPVLPWLGGASDIAGPVAGAALALPFALVLLVLVPLLGLVALLCFPAVGAAAGWFVFRSRLIGLGEKLRGALSPSGEGVLIRARDGLSLLREQRTTAIRRRDEILNEIGVAEERRLR